MHWKQTERQLKKLYYIFIATLALLVASCDLKSKLTDDEETVSRLQVERYDRLESRYLTTGDFSALQLMNTNYPMETRTLVEDILQLGEVNDPEINTTFLNFFQDSTLQLIITDAEAQYANMDDINTELDKNFNQLKRMLPNIEMPTIYAQISALDQSIVIGDKAIGISLDKYLGKDYPLYKKFYSAQQRESMQRKYIVPDCLTFFLLSLYPMDDFDSRTQLEHDLHMGAIMWVCNRAMESNFFKTIYVDAVEDYMKRHPRTTVSQLLERETFEDFKLNN